MNKEHVSSQFDSNLASIRLKLLEMGGKVELMISKSMKSIVERDSELAEQIVAMDAEVNRLEVEIDEKCLHLLALRQPAARDLRFVTLALKTVVDLERIGDECVNIARRAMELNREPQLKPYIDLPRMAEAAANAVQAALDAFVRQDVQAALAVCRADTPIDELHGQLQRELITFMMEDPTVIQRALSITCISKFLERIADHATNIAEMVVFMVDGVNVRHARPTSQP
ncbi:phosphate transport system regulatory protein PhoU [Citrifermentans bemidjiense Bem]|uniref:Phosphate-specific transport system accessory protein PhoU n=1 Tax=Citrifermentans bemidjiense (strain ATCC BAA-1014 / DSM 16622 / JCM 12645 / Bem) TaxID=404380 RepID=B5EB16_CITBB|nr:phosphate signaling complex protein PhoU [Citrifermentans bemidjiense]ACH38877.1 phosphate transport system regulatory protein PhoU [Citrifermentans bemidjiense Bem]